jgi:hypothetical protein
MDKGLVTKNDLLDRMNDLQYKINTWGATNSQSNPGAVMDLRWMKKEVIKIEKQLDEIRLKQKNDIKK